MNGALLRDMPFANPDRIVALGVSYTGNAQRTTDWLSYPDLQDWQAAATGTFEATGVGPVTAQVQRELRAPDVDLPVFDVRTVADWV